MIPGSIRNLLSGLAVFLLTAIPAWAHPALGTIAQIEVAPDGRIEIVVTHDALAYALNDTSARVTDPQMYALLDGPEEGLAAAFQDGRERFESGFQIFANGQPLEIKLTRYPTLETVAAWREINPTERLPYKEEFIAEAKLPPGASTISVRAPSVFGEVILGVKVPGREPEYMPIAPGETSPKFDVSMVGSSAAASVVGGAPGGPHVDVAPSPSVLNVAWRYIKLGYRHIIPEGHDHELFIFGLFLLNSRLKDLIWQTTTFTIAHTTTLTLATLHLVSIPSSVVEPVIALTIAFIAIENLFVTKIHPWRPAVAFVFGLVHGLGFASGLLSIGLPTAQLATGIIAFNVGVEAGHMTIIVAAFAIFGWWRDRKWFRARVGNPLSVAIAAIALFWFAARIIPSIPNILQMQIGG